MATSLSTSGVLSGTRNDLKPLWTNDAALMWTDDAALMWGGSNVSTARYVSVSINAGAAVSNQPAKQASKSASVVSGAAESAQAAKQAIKQASTLAGGAESSLRIKQGVAQVSELTGLSASNTGGKRASVAISALLGAGIALASSKRLLAVATSAVFGPLVSVLHQRGGLFQKQVIASILPGVRKDISIDYAPQGAWCFVGLKLQALTDIRMWDDDDALMWTDDNALMWRPATPVYPGISMEVYQ